MQVRVMEGHVATYPDPIRLKAGDTLTLTGQTDEWDGHTWLWAQGPDGKAGWVPDTIVENVAGLAKANRDYSAMELTCSKDDVLIVVEETHGWTWCRSRTGDEGWVPSRNLSRLDPPVSA